MKVWLITDTHFGHDKMVDFCGRPVDFADRILSHLGSMVHEDDLLIHLGDVCIGDDMMWHDRLDDSIPNVPKILIRGNHDRKSDHWYMSHGWIYVSEIIGNHYFGKKVLLSHFPIHDIGYEINIHGHFHNSDHRRQEPELVAIKNEKQKLLAIENTDYKPVLLEKFMKPSSNIQTKDDALNSK